MEPELGQPIMSYREKIMMRGIVVHRELTLYPGLLLIHWHGRGNRGESRIPLAEISPEPNRTWQIDPALRLGASLLGFCGGAAILLVALGLFGRAAHRVHHPPVALFILAAFFAAMAVWGIVSMINHRKQIETVWFKNRQLQVVFSINRTKLEAERFDAFVAQVLAQVPSSIPGR